MMASDTSLNIVLGQGHAVKSIYNVKKQSLELQQHFASQQTDVKEKRSKETVQKFSAENSIQITKDDAGRKNKYPRKAKKGSGEQDDGVTGATEREPETEGTIIDIKV